MLQQYYMLIQYMYVYKPIHQQDLNYNYIYSPIYFSTFLPMQPVTTIQVPIVLNTNYIIQQSQQNQPQLSEVMLDPYTVSILNYQNYLNLQLLKNQNLISTFLKIKKQDERSKSLAQTTNSNSQNLDYVFSFTPFLPTLQPYKQSNQHPQPTKKQCQYEQPEPSPTIQKKKLKKTTDSDYEPQQSDQQNYKLNKSSQSKNVPKNFSKAILLFIKHKQNRLQKLVEQQNFNWSQFLQLTKKLKGNINSIAQLKSLWVDQENKYARVFRIISNMYLRRYSLQHIFNSRVQDFSKHLKYRNKIQQALKNPKEFTRMKDY